MKIGELAQIDALASRNDTLTSIGASFSEAMQEVSDTADQAGKLARAGSKALKAAGQKVPSNKAGHEVASGIRSFTRSPVTHAALAATAAIVPVGTVVAAVAEVGIGIAEAGAAIADAADDIGNFFGGLFGGGGPAPLSPLQVRKQGRFLAAQMLIAGTSKSPEKRKAAKAKVAAFVAKGNIPIQKAMGYTQALSNGFTPAEAKKFAKVCALRGTDDRSKVFAVAAKHYKVLRADWLKANPGKKPAPVHTSKITAALNKAAVVLVKKAKAAKAKHPLTNGIWVGRSGAKKHGSFSQSTTGGLGVVVLKSGRAIVGRWKAKS